MMRSVDSRCLRVAHVAALLIIAGGIVGGAASAGTLDRIGLDKTIRIAYREDARPFSYKDKIDQPAGFMVDLCREVAKKLAKELNLTTLNVTYVAVTDCRSLRSHPAAKGGPLMRADQRHAVPTGAGRFLYCNICRRCQPDDPRRWSARSAGDVWQEDWRSRWHDDRARIA